MSVNTALAPPQPGARPADTLRPEEWCRLQQKMRGFAHRRLRDPAAADDAVADTMLALLEAPHAFRGESQLGTYAIGVLKHKLVDSIRMASRERPLSDGEEDWAERGEPGPGVPAPGSEHSEDPLAQLARRQSRDHFWLTLRGALEQLPERLREIFWLREVAEWETAMICRHLGISEGHAHVLSHRARRQLRAAWGAATP